MLASLATAIASVLAFFGGPTFGDQGISQLSQWLTSAGTVRLASTTASLRVPSLTNCDTIDTNGSGVLSCGSDDGGVGGSGFSTTSADYWQTTKWFANYPFPSNATTTGLGFYASTTIGSGTQTTGLTIFGGATTTGNLAVNGTTRLATSLTGLALTTSGTVSAVTTGTLGSTGVIGISGGVPAYVATSTLFGSATPGHVLMWNGSAWTPSATATCVAITGSASLCDGSDATAAGGADPFTWATNFGALNAATSSVLWAQSGINASSTSNFAEIRAWGDIVTGIRSGTAVIKAFAGNGTDYVQMYNTGTFGQLESTNTFVLTAPSGVTVTGTNNPQLRVQYGGGSFRSLEIYHDDTTATLTNNATAGNIVLAPGTGGGFMALASSTLGAGAQATGLTIFGGATTTANAYFNSFVGIGTTTPTAPLAINANGLTTPAFLIGSTTSTLFGVNSAGGIFITPQQPATSTTITLNWATTGNQVEYRIGTAAVTITLINATTSLYWGSVKRVWVCNPGGTAGALTWQGVEWIGTAPTQTTTANQCDLYSFNVTKATSTTAFKVAGAASTGFQ